ncbi:MAG: hypothetical protein JJU31_13360 [Wenzhouxiangella sp.]|nr:hypothetical protein [Wenzhouxiangella sp.]MCH8477663.1 hypothetical protein [Wenzhouxiangella sp.]
MEKKIVEMMQNDAQAPATIDEDALKNISGGCGMGGCQPNPFSATLCPDGTWMICQ